MRAPDGPRVPAESKEITMHTSRYLAAALAAAAFLPCATSPAMAQGWTGTGELGLAASRGNARSENVNAKLAMSNEDARWKHDFHVAILRAKGEATGDFDGDGVAEERFELNANRYELGATSALKFSERGSWLAALRYENDDFAPYSSQSTLSLGYGHRFIDTDTTRLATQVGPGYRRAKLAGTGETESGLILRGKVDYLHSLTDSTDIIDTFLVEAGDDNTFAQNDFGVAVKINASFALKAALQVRHNTEVEPGVEKTDTLMTVNLVYTMK